VASDQEKSNFNYDKKLRIVFVTPEFIELKTGQVVAGGLANYLYKITAVLNKMGHNVHVVIIGSKRKDLNYNGIFLHFINRKNLFGIRKFRKCANPDSMVIRHFVERFNKRQNIDIIQYTSYTATGQFPARTIPSCVRISSYALLHWGAIGEMSEKQKVELSREQEMFKKTRFIFGPSSNTNAFIKKDLGLDIDIKTIETPFVPYDKVEDESVYNEFLRDKKYVLFFGTLWPLKGSDEIADMIHDYLGDYEDMYFVIVGKQNKNPDGTYPLDKIKANAKEYASRLIYIPSQTHATLYPIIRNAKAVVLPSRYDNLPNTCIEAMGLGKIVLASRDAGFEQLIEDGKSGFLFQNSNAKSLKEGIDRIMQSTDDKLEEISANAKARTLLLTPQKIAAQMLDYYKYVIDNWTNY
jgi:glycosyltransferase involved in cell wall biosynthesis